MNLLQASFRSYIDMVEFVVEIVRVVAGLALRECTVRLQQQRIDPSLCVKFSALKEALLSCRAPDRYRVMRESVAGSGIKVMP